MSVGDIVMKGNVCKVCLFVKGDVIVGFVGVIVDVLVLVEWFEGKLE